MKLLTRWWKKLLYLLITGSTSVFIAACYGPPIVYGRVGAWTIKVKDGMEVPVKGVEVTICHYKYEGAEWLDTLLVSTTDDSGIVSIPPITQNIYEPYLQKAYLKDIDGADNGGLFADTLIEKSGPDTTEVILRVKP